MAGEFPAIAFLADQVDGAHAFRKRTASVTFALPSVNAMPRMAAVPFPPSAMAAKWITSGCRHPPTISQLPRTGLLARNNFRLARHSAVIRRIGRVLARIARKRCVAHSPRETLLEPKSSGTDGSRRPQREVGSSECEVENAPELGGAFQYHRPYGNGTHGESSRRPLTL